MKKSPSMSVGHPVRGLAAFTTVKSPSILVPKKIGIMENDLGTGVQKRNLAKSQEHPPGWLNNIQPLKPEPEPVCDPNDSDPDTEITRTTWWLYVVGLLDVVAVCILVPVVPMYALSLGVSKTSIGFYVATYGGLQMISGPCMGYLSDSIGSKIILVFTMFMIMVSYMVLALSMFMGGLYLFVLSRLLAGLFKHSQTMVRTHLSNIVPVERRKSVFSQFRAIADVGAIVGPLIGGYISKTSGGLFTVFSLAAFLFFLNTIIVMHLIPEPPARPPLIKKQSQVAVCFAYARNEREELFRLWDVFMMQFFVNFSIMLYQGNFVITLNEKYGISTDYVGYILSYQALVNTITGFATGPFLRTSDINSLMLWNSMLMCGSLYAGMQANTIATLMCVLVPLSFAASILRAATAEMMLLRSQEGAAVVNACLGQSTISLGRMLSPMLSGYLLDLDINGPGKAAVASSLVTVLVAIHVFSLRMDKYGHVPPNVSPRILATIARMEALFHQIFH